MKFFSIQRAISLKVKAPWIGKPEATTSTKKGRRELTLPKQTYCEHPNSVKSFDPGQYVFYSFFLLFLLRANIEIIFFPLPTRATGESQSPIYGAIFFNIRKHLLVALPHHYCSKTARNGVTKRIQNLKGRPLNSVEPFNWKSLNYVSSPQKESLQLHEVTTLPTSTPWG